MHVYMYARMCVCMYVCMHVRVMHACVYACMRVSVMHGLYACMRVCMHACLFVHFTPNVRYTVLLTEKLAVLKNTRKNITRRVIVTPPPHSDRVDERKA